VITERPLRVRNSPLSTKRNRLEPGSVLLVVVLLVALLAAVVMGHLQVNTEEIQLVQNHAGGVEALMLAEAGLNEALARLGQDPRWNAGFRDKPFGRGTYTVVLDGSTLTSTAVTSRGFVAQVQAEVAKTPGMPPRAVRIEQWRINP
jgi:hypothetical protein